MRRIVLDTSVVVSAFRSKRGASYAILDLVAERRLVPLATPPLFLQYEEVLKRPDQLAASGLTLDAVDGILNALASAVEGVTVYYAWRPQLPDPGDEMVLDAAVNGRADALVTYNVRDFASAALRFGVRIVRPSEILRKTRS